MIYKLVISPEAFREIELAECFFKTKNLERSFINDLNKQFLFLEQVTLSRLIRYKNVRIHLLEIYNYSIHYSRCSYFLQPMSFHSKSLID